AGGGLVDGLGLGRRRRLGGRATAGPWRLARGQLHGGDRVVGDGGGPLGGRRLVVGALGGRGLGLGRRLDHGHRRRRAPGGGLGLGRDVLRLRHLHGAGRGVGLALDERGAG